MSLLTRPEALGVPAGVGHRAVRGRRRPAPSPGTPTALMAFHTVRCRMWGLSTVALCGGFGLALFGDADAQPAQFPGRPRPCPAKTLPQLWRLTGPGATCRVERVTGAGPRTMGGLCLRGRQADPPPASERLCCALGVEGSRLAATDTMGLPAPGGHGRTQGGPKACRCGLTGGMGDARAQRPPVGLPAPPGRPGCSSGGHGLGL
ncbi:uncharacterized protein LOC116577960 [Mustela erminea]|uniref:uncharacterized protein LOC116577960 n=1 Tax=Mustela erminea TaxID=36723 RepID=UPI0013867243|nr:uncharacterized protein LOC116577960 [Mustela erminea]